MIQVRYSEKATKFEKKFIKYLTFLIDVKRMGRFFQSFVAFLEYLNFKGLNALHYALKRGSREMVEDIIDALSEPMRLSFICRTGNYF